MDYDGGDIAGDDATCETGARLVQYESKRKRPPRPAPASSAAGEATCLVCLNPGTMPKEWRRGHLHRECWNGVRAFLRKLKSKQAKDSEWTLFQKKREEWRAKVLPFVVEQGSRRPPSLRDAAGVETADSHSPQRYEDRQRISEVRLLDKDRYKTHRKSVDGWASDEASSEFEREIEKQSDQEMDRHGNPRLRVDGVEVIRTVRGEIHRLGPKGGFSLRSMPLASDDPPSSASESPRQGGSSTAKRRRPDKSPSKFSCASTSRASPAEKRNSQDSSLASLACGSERLAGRSLGVVEFLTEKARLAKECDTCIATANLKSSISVRLRHAMSKVSESQRLELVGNPEKTLTAIEDVILALTRFRADATSVTVDSIASSYSQFEKLKVELQQREVEGDEALAGVKFILDQGSAISRKSQLSLGYQRRRFEERCVAGKVPGSLAKHMSLILQQSGGKQQQRHICINMSATDFDFMKFGLWDETAEVGKSVLGKFEEPLLVSCTSLNVCRARRPC